MPENEERLHLESKGCKLEKRMQYSYEALKKNDLSGGPTIEGKYCTTHQVAICRCGWEWRYHELAFQKPNLSTAIKRACFLCNKPLNKDVEKRYKQYGNMCHKGKNNCDKRTTLVGLGKMSVSKADKKLKSRRERYNFYEKNNLINSSSSVN